MQVPALPQSPEQDDDYCRAVLLMLIDQGARLSNRITEAGLAATASPPDAQTAIAHERVSRATRYNVALLRHIKENPAGTQRTSPTKRTIARAKIIRGVEDAIHRKRREVDTERLYAEMAEHLEDPALEFDLESRPIEELIEEISRDLGVATQARSWVWRRRSPTEVAALRTRAAASPAPQRSNLAEGNQPRKPQTSSG